jgi:geranylgeranyl diphosphate synthase type I
MNEIMEHYLDAVEAEMRAVVCAPTPEVHDFYAYLHYHLGWTDEQLRPVKGRAGKRLRPLFCLLSCAACGGDWQRALPAAAAVELLHNFSLVHDDIEDSDATRRGRPTLWRLWSLPQALNAGDALFALAHQALLRLTERGVPAENVVAAVEILDRTCLRLTEGQFLDIGFEGRTGVSVEEYLQMIAGKTAALVAASCELGALVAAAPQARSALLCAFGHHLGLAFQVQDDLLGLWGDPAVTGKPVGADLLRRKKTLPLVHGLTHSPALRALLAQPELSPADCARALELLEATGSHAWAQEQAEEYMRQALAALDAADLRTPAADSLRGLALGLLNRSR